MDEEKKQLFISFLHFLGDVLGKNYEIVLHVKEENQFYIEEIINAHVSRQDNNSSITGLALKLFREKIYLEKNFVTNYDVQTIDGKLIQGSTFFIKNEDDDIKGMVCINHDLSDLKNISDTLTNLMASASTNKMIEFHSNEQSNKDIKNERAVEVLSTNIYDTINEFINPNLLDQVDLNIDTKINIVKKLNEQGIFNIKGSVAKTAKMLKVSESSIYRYIKMINQI